METTYKMNAFQSEEWAAHKSRERIRQQARSRARKAKASVVTIETPTGVIVDTLEVNAWAAHEEKWERVGNRVFMADGPDKDAEIACFYGPKSRTDPRAALAAAAPDMARALKAILAGARDNAGYLYVTPEAEQALLAVLREAIVTAE